MAYSEAPRFAESSGRVALLFLGKRRHLPNPTGAVEERWAPPPAATYDSALRTERVAELRNEGFRGGTAPNL